ncbi:MAG TPA: GNAT family N-acetyltransferase [Actinomycetota bacterium]|nr:GNAT family N-acetyltransferase [Actinomycetota bacterium]
MDVRVRPIEDAEVEPYLRVIGTAFGEHLSPEDVARERAVLELDRCLAAFDGLEMVGGACAASFVLRVPGAEVRAAGVTGVGVKPTHRRRGVNSALMRRQLDDVHEAGEAIAALHASEGGIYGRYGYGLASFLCAVDLERAGSRFVRGQPPGDGRVRLIERAEALETLRPVYERATADRPGSVRLDARWFEYRFDETHHHGAEEPPRFFFAAHESAGGLDAYAVYRIRHEWPRGLPRYELILEDLQALTPEAYARMWRYVLDVDLVGRVRSWNRPVDEPLLRLLAEPRRLGLTVRDGLWVRLVDLRAALEARTYAGEGAVTFEVHDPFCPWNEGRHLLEAGPEGASCRAGGAPDVVCTATELGAAYLGGVSFRALHRAGLVHEERRGALARADALFGWDPAPWCPFVF